MGVGIGKEGPVYVVYIPELLLVSACSLPGSAAGIDRLLL